MAVLLILFSILKLPSPEANPATQLGSSLLLDYYSNIIGLIFGKAKINSGDRPLLIELLIESNLLKLPLLNVLCLY